LQLFYKPLVWALACGGLEMCCNVGQGFPSSFCGGRKNKINSSKFAPNFYNCMSFFALLLTEPVLPKDGLLLTNSEKENRPEQKTFTAY